MSGGSNAATPAPGLPPAARFPIRIGRAFRLPLLLWGVRRTTAEVVVGERELTARFGFFGARVLLADIERWEISGPYRWYSAIGVRRSLRGGDLTFGGSTHGGVCLVFRAPQRVAGLRIPALYLTVDDLEGLTATLAARGIPGQDARERC